jgi:hypothetical protein
VLEFRRSLAAVIGCYARAENLDAVSVVEALPMRLAPDELLLVTESRDGAATLAAAETALAADAGSLVFDVSDGYAIWSLLGDWEEVSLRLCAVPVSEPPALIQALFAHVPAKLVIRSPDELLVVVSSVLSHHVRRRILDSCRDLSPTELEPAPIAIRLREAAA